MNRAIRILWYAGFFWSLILSAGTFLQYYDFKHHSEFLEIKRQAVATGWYLPAFYCHIIGSSIILIVGFFQFSKKMRNNKALHRLLGKVYVFGILFFAAPGAFVMTAFINRGPWVTLSFLLQNILWVIFTLYGWISIVKGNTDDHVKMMHRSYALAFAAVTLRLYIWLLTVLGNGVHFDNNYIIIAFLSWVPNLLVVEWVNRKKTISGI